MNHLHIYSAVNIDMDKKQLEKLETEYKEELQKKYTEVVDTLQWIAVKKFKEEVDVSALMVEIEKVKTDMIQELEEQKDEFVSRLQRIREQINDALKKYHVIFNNAKVLLDEIQKFHTEAKKQGLLKKKDIKEDDIP